MSEGQLPGTSIILDLESKLYKKYLNILSKLYPTGNNIIVNVFVYKQNQRWDNTVEFFIDFFINRN